jgi:hypothetical protein
VKESPRCMFLVASEMRPQRAWRSWGVVWAESVGWRESGLVFWDASSLRDGRCVDVRRFVHVVVGGLLEDGWDEVMDR